ncbi:MAG: MerR family transcriptional regulator [Planctomycetota bacterium]|nr:MerR family transcriptional regulator [Planctomycetota bacterium]
MSSLATETMTTAASSQATRTYNINEASKACGLSPSVLRIWELRYGWPNPRRRANGYRAYSQHQVNELKRVAQLVKNGTPISQIIVDGMPRLPAIDAAPQPPRGLPQTRAWPRSPNPQIREFQDAVITALDTRQTSVVHERVQRAVWTLRPVDEPAAVLVPVLAGIFEARANGRPFEDEALLLATIRTRVQQLTRLMRSSAQPVAVVPLGDEATHVAAQLAALVLAQRNYPAVYAPQRPEQGPWLAVGGGDAPGSLARITLFGEGESTGFTALLDPTRLPPWAAR